MVIITQVIDRGTMKCRAQLNWLNFRKFLQSTPDSKVPGTNMGPSWVLSAPGGPHFGPHEPYYQGHLAYLWGRVWDVLCVFWFWFIHVICVAFDRVDVASWSGGLCYVIISTFTHRGLVTPYDLNELSHHWFSFLPVWCQTHLSDLILTYYK